MASIKINSKDVDIKTVLAEISKLDSKNLEKIMSQVSNYLASKKAPSLTKEESRIIKKINEGLPEKTQLRYRELRLKLLRDDISDKEYKELQKLTPIFEAKGNERLALIIELAALWNTSTTDVMERLDLKPPPPIHA